VLVSGKIGKIDGAVLDANLDGGNMSALHGANKIVAVGQKTKLARGPEMELVPGQGIGTVAYVKNENGVMKMILLDIATLAEIQAVNFYGNYATAGHDKKIVFTVAVQNIGDDNEIFDVTSRGPPPRPPTPPKSRRARATRNDRGLQLHAGPRFRFKGMSIQCRYMSDQKTFVILDGNALLHRAWHAIPPLSTADGRVVNAVYGFAMVIEKMRTDLKPDFMAVAWDLPGGTFRHEEYEPYKATRVQKAQELYDQIPMIQELLKPYGVPSLSVPGFEGDDILGTISAMNEKRGVKTLIVTGDLDSLQLVTENTEVVFFVKGLSVTKRYTIDAVKERYGLLPTQLIDYKTLVGDTSDNLPGIPGIGEKSALELLLKHETVDGIFAAMERGELPEKYVKKFSGQEKTAAQMKRLVTVVCDAPLTGFSIDDAKMQKTDIDALLPMLRDLEFKTLLKKYEGKSEEVAPELPKQEIQRFPSAPSKRHASLPRAKLAELDIERVGLFIVTKTQDLFGGSIASLAVTDGRHVFVAVDPSVKELEVIVNCVAKASVLVGHDIKELLHTLRRAGVSVDRLLMIPMIDTLVAAYLLASDGRAFAYHDVVTAHIGASLPFDGTADELIGALLPLASMLERKIESEGMASLFATIEMPLIPVLFRMERDGFAVDTDHLATLSKKFDDRLQELTKSIHHDAGREFNINSPSQLADVLFVDLAIPTKGIKKTKSGFSTAAPELEKITEAHPVVDKISEYRELAKLKGTYADALPKLVEADGRIHARFNQCVAATGRLSGSDPNLQNIPIRSDLGREIRKAFVASPGCVLVSADYSQIELRLAASIAQDASFIQAFRDGADIHNRTAAEMWNIDEKEVTKDQRYAAKAINFGILYGIGARALGKSAGVPFEEAKDFIDRYFVAHPAIREYLDAMKAQAHAQGFVASLYGRRRYLPDVHSGMPQLVASAERMAINMPVQGTQADIIKKAMIVIDAWIQKSSIAAKMIAQVHDELVFEVSENDAAALAEGVVEHMKSVADLGVPLIVDVDTADSWGDME
jgi:DNA polymerase-1